MTGPQTLARPLAQRVAGLPEPTFAPVPVAPVPEAVMEAAFAALDAGKTHYTDRPGIQPLRKRITDHLNARYGLSLTPDDATITCGSTEARFVVVKQLTKPSTAVLALDRSRIAPAVALAGVELTTDASAVNISLAYLTPQDDPAQVENIVRQAENNTWWIVWDVSAAEGDFHPAQYAALAPRVVTVGSFSDKLPGWRVGWMAGSKMAGKLRAYKQTMTICTTSVAQWAALGLEEA